MLLTARHALTSALLGDTAKYSPICARHEPQPAGRSGRCGVALALDVGQALGELAVSDPDNIHATHVPVRPVVAPAHDGAS
jgi:hypothetical protein